MSDIQRPNVLFIVSDDHRYDTIGALGNHLINTPNLDRLCDRGAAFYRHFCTTPICTPARAEILTGRDSFANGVPWFGMPINPSLTLLPQTMKAGGYMTLHVGKWHNDGHPRDKGYDATTCVHPQDNLNDYGEHGHIMRFEEGVRFREGHSSEVMTDAAIDLLATADNDKPWFLYLGYAAPHDPHMSPEPFASMYDPAQLPLPPNYMPEHPFDNGDMVIRDELLENWPRAQEAIRRYVARYYGIISHLDWNIGRLLGALEARGQLDNTIVVFTGDQGLAAGSHGLLGKENMYDHSIAAPLILAGPGIRAGVRSSAMSHHVDLFPTICDLTGVSLPDSASDGHSLLPVLNGEAARVRDEVLCEFYSPEEPGQQMRHTQRAIRTERWKLTWFPLSERCQLFDLARDPAELVDLLAPWRIRRRNAESSGASVWTKDTWAAVDLYPPYDHEEIKRVTADLRERLNRAMVRQGDPLEPTCPDPFAEEPQENRS